MIAYTVEHNKKQDYFNSRHVGLMHEIRLKSGDGGYFFPAAYFKAEQVKFIWRLIVESGKSKEFELVLIEGDH